jgi:thiol-disulfide isomerase/thioredoxin
VDGHPYTLSEQLGDKGLLLMFICNHCPYVVSIAERLVGDVKTLQAEGVNVLAIMSNDYRAVEADSPPNMKAFAAHYGFTFPYLVDEGQAVGRAYNAICTPDFFGFNCNGELQYRGRLDDAGRGSVGSDSAEGRTKELVEAMQQVARTGQGPIQQIPSMGCSIKWRE